MATLWVLPASKPMPGKLRENGMVVAHALRELAEAQGEDPNLLVGLLH